MPPISVGGRASCAHVEAAAVHVDGEPSSSSERKKGGGGEIARGKASDLRVAGRSAGLCSIMCVGKASFVLPTERAERDVDAFVPLLGPFSPVCV